MAKKDEAKCMDPENPDASGLLHFYLDQEENYLKLINGEPTRKWNFLTEAQYQERKNELPDLCFASRHPIKALQESLKRIHD